MLDPCRDLRGALGGAALGGRDPADDIALRAHLDGCAACRAELHDLQLVAAALDAVPLSALDAAPVEPSSALGERVLDRVARERGAMHSRRVRRAFVGTGAFASVAAAIVAILLVVGPGTGDAGTRVVLPAVGPERATATATLRSKEAGTDVEMKVSGLHDGDYYWLWITDADGKRLSAGTFRGTDEPKKNHFTAAMPLSEARRIWVTDDEDRVVLDAPVPVST